jgi:PAS domain S-box-containing protein
MRDMAPVDTEKQARLLNATCVALGLGLLAYDKNNTIIYSSRQLLRFYTIPKDAIAPGKHLSDFLAAVHDSGIRTSTIDGRTRNIANKQEWIAERLTIHAREWHETREKLASNIWIRQYTKTSPDGAGIMIIQDISGAKAQEEKWRSDIERVKVTEEILDSLTAPLFVKNRNLHYVAVNQAFCALFQISHGTVLGQSAWDLLDNENAERTENEDRLVLETGVPCERLELIFAPDGTSRHMIIRKRRIGVPGQYLLVTMMDDITAFMNGGMATTDISSQPAKPQQSPEPRVQDMESAATVAVQSPEKITGRGHVLVLLNDPVASLKCLRHIGTKGHDVLAATDIEDLADILEGAQAAGLEIDLVVVDAVNVAIVRSLPTMKNVGVFVKKTPQMITETLTEIDAALASLQRPVVPMQGQDHTSACRSVA